MKNNGLGLIFLIPKINIRIKLFGADGGLILTREQPGNSWNRNFFNWLFSLCSQCGGDGQDVFGKGYMSIREGGPPAGTYYGEVVSNADKSAGAGLGLTIKVGSDDTPFDIDDFDLGNVVPYLTHSATTYAQAYDSVNHVWKNTMTAVITNNTVGAVTANELCLMRSDRVEGINLQEVCTSFRAQYLYPQYLMVERTLITPGVELNVNEQLEVSYEIAVDFAFLDEE